MRVLPDCKQPRNVHDILFETFHEIYTDKISHTYIQSLTYGSPLVGLHDPSLSANNKLITN